MPAQAGIQFLAKGLGPRLRGDERGNGLRRPNGKALSSFGFLAFARGLGCRCRLCRYRILAGDDVDRRGERTAVQAEMPLPGALVRRPAGLFRDAVEEVVRDTMLAGGPGFLRHFPAPENAHQRVVGPDVRDALLEGL